MSRRGSSSFPRKMAILEPTGENDLTQLWTLITELSDQLNQNRSMSVSLYGLTGKIKNEALNSQMGFVLRRFNMDKTQEEYDAELENMNITITQENRSLQHDNKQLNALIKEYEQTLETLMTAFRNRAQYVQERELSLIRDYETKLLAREEENATTGLLQTSSISSSLSRLSHALREILRSQNGEDTASLTDDIADKDDCEPWMTSEASSHSLERDTELARLEKENEELRRLLGLLPSQPRKDARSDFRPIFDAPNPIRLPTVQRQAGANIGKLYDISSDRFKLPV